jgi:cell division protein FtsN
VGETTREPPAVLQDRSGQEVRRVNRGGLAALACLAAGLLVGNGLLGKAAGAAERPDPVAVKRDGVSVYMQMATTSIVVMQLMRGDLVEVSPAGTTPEGKWCRVREAAVWGRSGFVRCEDLEPERAKAAAPPVVTGPPVSEVPTGEARPSEAAPSIPVPPPKPATTGSPPPVKAEQRYAITVATLVFERNALSLKERLEKLGYSPTIHMITTPLTRHRVSVGELASREEGEQAARSLKADGFSSTLVTADGGKVRLEVGSYFHLNEAIDVAHRLQKKGYTTKIDSQTVPTSMHQVRVGTYQNREEALKALDNLKRQGFTPLVVSQ